MTWRNDGTVTAPTNHRHRGASARTRRIPQDRSSARGHNAEEEKEEEKKEKKKKKEKKTAR